MVSREDGSAEEFGDEALLWIGACLRKQESSRVEKGGEGVRGLGGRATTRQAAQTSSTGKQHRPRDMRRCEETGREEAAA